MDGLLVIKPWRKDPGPIPAPSTKWRARRAKVAAYARRQWAASEAEIRRRQWVLAGIVVITTILLTIALSLLIFLRSPLTTNADKLAAETAVIAAATLLMAILAAIVAIRAYQLSSRVAHLCPDVRLGPARDSNVPILLLDTAEGAHHDEASFQESWSAPPGHIPDYYTGLLRCKIRIHNLSRATARNPAVRCIILGILGLRDQLGWTKIREHPACFEWEGGGDYFIHGTWARDLPAIQFIGAYPVPATLEGAGEVEYQVHELSSGSTWVRGNYSFIIEIVAEGYRDVYRIPIHVMTSAELRSLWSTEGQISLLPFDIIDPAHLTRANR